MLTRATATGRPLALGPFDVVEIDERKARDQATQSERLRAAIPEGARVIALDERGRTMSSPKFADLLARERDGGCPHLAFLIGGADGLDEAARIRPDMLLSFGPDGLAAHAGAHHAVRTDLSRDGHPRRDTIPQGLTLPQHATPDMPGSRRQKRRAG